MGMSELRVKAIILPCVAQWGREISKKKAGSCSSLGIASSYDERPQHTPGYTQMVLALAGAIGLKCYAEAVPKGGGTGTITFGLYRVWRLNKENAYAICLQYIFAKPKWIQRNAIVFPLLHTHLCKFHFYSGQ